MRRLFGTRWAFERSRKHANRDVYTRLAMSKESFRFVCSLLLALLLPPALLAQHGFVHASGPDLVDGSGKPLLLRGINLGNWLEPEGY
ncbi:MAG TPA: hypothetical protein VF786_00505, partial [Terriglobales bacterium]